MGKLSKLMGFTLVSFQSTKSSEELVACWKKSGLSLSHFMRPRNENEKDMKEFLLDRVSLAPSTNLLFFVLNLFTDLFL